MADIKHANKEYKDVPSSESKRRVSGVIKVLFNEFINLFHFLLNLSSGVPLDNQLAKDICEEAWRERIRFIESSFQYKKNSPSDKKTRAGFISEFRKESYLKE